MFPLITAISGLSITMAGIGARDGAAIALLGWCGIAAADAEATSVVTLLVSVLVGVVGGIVLLRQLIGAEDQTRDPFWDLREPVMHF